MGSSLPLVGHSLAIFICAAVMMSVSIMAVALRTFVRLYTVRAFGWDDALMVIALVIPELLTNETTADIQLGIVHRPGCMLDGGIQARCWPQE